jgi:hypothetical protein
MPRRPTADSIERWCGGSASRSAPDGRPMPSPGSPCPNHQAEGRPSGRPSSRTRPAGASGITSATAWAVEPTGRAAAPPRTWLRRLTRSGPGRRTSGYARCPTGGGSARQSAWFGTRRSAVRIRPARPALPIRAADRFSGRPGTIRGGDRRLAAGAWPPPTASCRRPPGRCPAVENATGRRGPARRTRARPVPARAAGRRGQLDARRGTCHAPAPRGESSSHVPEPTDI